MSLNGSTYSCDFCGKSNYEVATLVHNDSANLSVCNECVDYCKNMLDQQGSRRMASANWSFGSMGEYVEDSHD